MKKILFLGLSAILAAGITSCKDDALVEDPLGGDIVTKDASFYLNVDVFGQGENTRAVLDQPDGEENGPKFDSGEKYENDVYNIWLVFYDSMGRRVSVVQAMNNGSSNLLEGTGSNNSENKIYSGIVQVDVKHGLGTPTQVLTFINPITPNFDTNDDFATLEAVERTTRSTIISENNRFAMSKSGYYGVDPNSQDQNTKVRIIATPITPGQLKMTRNEAEEALKNDEEAVKIYVERYAAKVTLNLGSEVWTNKLEIPVFSPTMYAENRPKYTLHFVPEYWAVNAYEDQTFITKSFFMLNPDGTMSDQYASYEYMNNALGGANAWYWNSENLRRSYWAQSPSYYSSNYPRVSDDILDSEKWNPNTVDGRKAGFSLNYYSYADMKKNATKEMNSRSRSFVSGNADSEFTSIYVRENTVSGYALHNAYSDPMASPRAAIPSVVLVGSYTLDKGEGAKEIPEGTCFYVIGNNSDDYQIVASDADMVYYFLLYGLDLAIDEKGTPLFDMENLQWADGYEDVMEIVHPSKDVRGDMVLDSRFVTLQINPEKYESLYQQGKYIYALLNNKYEQVVYSSDNDQKASNNLNYINYQLLSGCGIARGFNGGKAYFNVSIKHLGFSRANNPNKDKNVSDSDFNWEAVQSGDFGVVRNHTYTIEATSIGGLGNAIPDPSVPIVPPTEPEANYIGAKIIVLNWAIVPTQSVVLK